jgi:hypothetical protein
VSVTERSPGAWRFASTPATILSQGARPTAPQLAVCTRDTADVLAAHAGPTEGRLAAIL